MDKREFKLRHAPPRELSAAELREAFERRMLSSDLYEVERQRRAFNARCRTRVLVKS